MHRPLAFAASIALLMTGLPACTPTTHVRGNLIEDHKLAEIEKDNATRATIRNVLGTPTARDPFNDNIWYYIGRRTEQYGVFAPEVTQKKIVRARFDDQGKLLDLAEIQADGRNIAINERVTPTGGHDNTLLKQFFGNLGRFNTKQSEDSGPIDPGL